MGIRHFGNATQKWAVEEATCGTGRLHMHSFSGNSVRYATSCAQPEQFQCATRANCFTQTLGATRARREGGHKLNKAVIERRTGSSRWTFGISQLQAHSAVTNLHDNMHYFFIPQLSSFACKSYFYILSDIGGFWQQYWWRFQLSGIWRRVMPPVHVGYAILRVFPYIYTLPNPHSYGLSVVQSLESFISARTMTSEEPNPNHTVCALAGKKTVISLGAFRSNCQTCNKQQSDNPLEMFVAQFTSSN